LIEVKDMSNPYEGIPVTSRMLRGRPRDDYLQRSRSQAVRGPCNFLDYLLSSRNVRHLVEAIQHHEDVTRFREKLLDQFTEKREPA